MRQDNHLSFWPIVLYVRKKKAPIAYTDAHTDRISRENNIIQIGLPGGSTKISMFEVFRFGPARPALIR